MCFLVTRVQMCRFSLQLMYYTVQSVKEQERNNTLHTVCTNSRRFSGPYTYITVFISLSFSLCRSFSPRSFTPVSVNKLPSEIATRQALYRHSKSPHSDSLSKLTISIIISSTQWPLAKLRLYETIN